MTEPRRIVIEGQTVLVMERRPPLPQHLDQLLARLRVYPIKITGWRADCGEQRHRLFLLADGPYTGPDGVRRDLRVEQCGDCEAVCVRDVSLDRLSYYAPGVPLRQSSLAPRRRDGVLGWYTGARRNQREYRRL
jgi:hypothetical protein